MNDNHFDKLVDGELSEEERRDLLLQLENEPGGWRRCALAFLEAQCWKQSLGAWAGKTESAETTPTVQYKKPSRWPSRLGMGVAVAASFFAAMWIGSLWRDWNGRPTGTDAVVGQFHDPFRSKPPFQTILPEFMTEHNIAAAPPPPPRPESEAEPWRVVTVSSPDGQQGRTINLPARERDRLDERWENTPSAIPSDVMQALNRTGHQVKQQRELIPVSLQDGRQMVMPVDQVDVHYVGRTY